MNPIATIASALPQAEEEQPSSSVVAMLKGQLPGRDLHRVEMTSGEDSFVFVMTGPTRAEWKKYRSEVSAGGDIDKLETAIESAALAQIRWPERAEVKAIFESHPGLVQNFAEQLAKLAKSEVEVRTKKL